MYQLEVKHYLIQLRFPPAEGWHVIVDVDAMERAKGTQHPEDKKARVEAAEAALIELGATIGVHSEHGRADVVAVHPQHGKYLVEVEGQFSKQKEQAMYSALGQTLLMTDGPRDSVRYAIAVPDEPAWERQVEKVPAYVKETLKLECLLVSSTGIRSI